MKSLSTFDLALEILSESHDLDDEYEVAQKLAAFTEEFGVLIREACALWFARSQEALDSE